MGRGSVERPARRAGQRRLEPRQDPVAVLAADAVEVADLPCELRADRREAVAEEVPDAREGRHDAGRRQAIARCLVGLPRGQQRRRGRRGLVARRLLPGERLEDPRRAPGRRLGGQRANRPPVQLHRLPVRGDPRRGIERRRGRPGAPPPVCPRARNAPTQCTSDPMPAWPPSSATRPWRRRRSAERDRRVDRVPHELVAEVVLARAVVGLEEGVCHELREWRRRGPPPTSTGRWPTTEGRNRRPTTAPADASARASGDRGRRRSSTVASIVSGTPDARTSSAVIDGPSPSMPTSSSTNSGIPSVRSWMAAMASSVTAWPSSRIRAITAVSSAVSRASRASSASRCVSRRVRHSPMPEPAASSSVRIVATTRSGTSGSRRARDASTSRLRSSAQWRSSNARSVGSVAASVRMSTRSRTSMRRRCDRAGRRSSSGCARRSTSRSPVAARPGDRRIDRARSPRMASGTSWSCGARPPLAVLKPAPAACRMTEPSSRVLPIPALPLSSSR